MSELTESVSTSCWIYRGSKQNEMYLYLPEPDCFDDLPVALMSRFGTPSLVMELELHAGRKLARADVDQVRRSLSENGFYLQMPPEIDVELYDAEA